MCRGPAGSVWDDARAMWLQLAGPWHKHEGWWGTTLPCHMPAGVGCQLCRSTIVHHAVFQGEATTLILMRLSESLDLRLLSMPQGLTILA